MFETNKPDQSRKFPSWAKVLIALLVAAPGTWWGINMRMKNAVPDPQELAKQAEAESRQIREQLIANLAEGKTVGAADELESGVTALETSATSLVGNDAIFCQGLANVIRGLIPVTRQYEEVYHIGNFADVMDVTTTKTRDDVRLRLNHLKDIQTVLERQSNLYDRMEHSLRTEFGELGTTPADGEALVKMAMASIGPKNQIRAKSRQAERDTCNHCLKAIELLDRTWGKWSVERGEILFTDAKNTRLYNGYADLIEAELQKQKESIGQVTQDLTRQK
jgi:hypothetical protein